MRRSDLTYAIPRNDKTMVVDLMAALEASLAGAA